MTYQVPAPRTDHFLRELADVHDRIDAIDPKAYDRTRNALGGATTWLGPFITHGIIDTREIASRLLDPERVPVPRSPGACYRLLFELGWREFFHRTWQLEGDDIFDDLHRAQAGVTDTRVPQALLAADTGIDVIDACIAHLIAHGTMHNHARLWLAALAANLGRSAWREPARWLHYHLLDGDLASNTLSWQWVAGTLGGKRYLANQENIDRFSGSRQPGSWLDVSYEELDGLPLPERLRERGESDLSSAPRGRPIEPLTGRVALRSIWHLDPRWQPEAEHRLVFIDTDWLAEWPLSDTRWTFIEHWAARCDARIVHGDVAALTEAVRDATVRRREYPACRDWPGEVEERQWLYPMPEKDFPSFSKYWKQVRASAGL